MLEDLIPRSAERFRSLPLLGSHAEDFARWLTARGYRAITAANKIWPLLQIDRWLRAQGVEELMEIDAAVLRQCRAAFRHRSQTSAAVWTLGQYLASEGLMRPQPPEPLTPRQQLVADYAQHLESARGLAPATIARHRLSAAQFLGHVQYDGTPGRLGTLTADDIESFVRARGQQLRRASLSLLIGDLRGFLRFVATRGVALSLSVTTIDTPRIYSQESLPRALPWDTVQALLESIDRCTTCAVRDYAMLFLMATYGLRIGEIAALTLGDIQWRQGRLSVPQSKTKGRLLLPLTDAAGAVIIEYLRVARPRAIPFRQLFVSDRAPIRPMTPGAVTAAFVNRARRSGLTIPFAGAHCLRHSYALRLLRNGTSLKLIGDLLGHRATESTGAYLCLATEDLRQVPLAVPPPTTAGASTERRS